jgi:hypothetical protein
MKPPNRSVSSTGQTGGVTVGTVSTMNVMNAPPATEQERAIALERLNLTLIDFADYGERPTDLGTLTSLERIRTDKTARQLYIILSNFFDPTIKTAGHGSDLIKFKKRYNTFVRKQMLNEQSWRMKIGSYGATTSSYAWSVLVEYCIMRLYLADGASVRAAGMELIEVNWEQAEEVFSRLVRDDAASPTLGPSAVELEELISEAAKLAATYRS